MKSRLDWILIAALIGLLAAGTVHSFGRQPHVVLSDDP